MRVTRIESIVRSTDAPRRPLREAVQALAGAGSVEVIVHTDDGLIGSGEADLGQTGGAPAALHAVIQQMLTPLVVGRNPERVRQIHEDLLRETEYSGSHGLVMFGIAAIDVALWDILGKAAGWPVYRLLGTARDRVPACAMVGWMHYSDDELKQMCGRAMEQGFAAVKIKVGQPNLDEDLRRLALVRGVVGKEVAVMVDAQQTLTLPEAMRRGRAFQEAGCSWFEEPLSAEDVGAYAELTRSLDIRVVTGENLYGRHAFGALLRAGAVDVVQADLRRAGGPTEILTIGALADAHRLPYSSSGGGAVHLNLLATMPNEVWFETALVGPRNRISMEKGCVLLPQGPGFAL